MSLLLTWLEGRRFRFADDEFQFLARADPPPLLVHLPRARQLNPVGRIRGRVLVTDVGRGESRRMRAQDEERRQTAPN